MVNLFMHRINLTLVGVFLIFTIISSAFAYAIIMKAYDSETDSYAYLSK